MHRKQFSYVLCSLFLVISLRKNVDIDIALSFIITPSISEISHISREHGKGRHAQAYALFNMAFAIGFLVGPLCGGFITKAKGWNTMVTTLSGLAIISLPPIILWTGGPIRGKRQTLTETQSAKV